MEPLQFVINPNTGRALKVGSRIWLQLVKQGILQNDDYKDEREIYKIEDNDNIDTLITEANKTLPYTQQAVKGRGKYAGKIVKRDKKLNPHNLAKYASKIATEIAPKVIGYEIDDEDDEISNIMEKMILDKMINTKNTQPKKNIKYNIKKNNDDDDDDDNDDDTYTCEGDDEDDEDNEYAF
jgi:uncharacterized membrane protein YheB (UPF0754 family)